MHNVVVSKMNKHNKAFETSLSWPNRAGDELVSLRSTLDVFKSTQLGGFLRKDLKYLKCLSKNGEFIFVHDRVMNEGRITNACGPYSNKLYDSQITSLQVKTFTYLEQDAQLTRLIRSELYYAYINN